MSNHSFVLGSVSPIGRRSDGNEHPSTRRPRSDITSFLGTLRSLASLASSLPSRYRRRGPRNASGPQNLAICEKEWAVRTGCHDLSIEVEPGREEARVSTGDAAT